MSTGQGAVGTSQRQSLFPAHPGSQQDIYGNNASLATPSHAITIPPSSSNTGPISISTSVPSANVRLSTTPLFPSPLAQASGPEEDSERTRGEDGDGESEDEGVIKGWGRARTGRDGSPLTREVSAPFGGKCRI